MKLTIVTVNYNNAQGLELTLKSVLDLVSRSGLSFEFIIVDGNSTDASLHIIDCYYNSLNKYCDDFKVISEQDSGIYDAMNKGISFGTGDYVIFMNSGDWFTEEAAVILDDFFLQKQTFSDEIYVFGISSELNGQRVKVKKFHSEHDLRKYPAVPHQSTFINLELHKNKMYNKDYKILADYNFFCDCYRSGKRFIYMSDSVISVFSQGGISTNSKTQMKFIREFVSIQYKYFNKVRWFTVFGLITKVWVKTGSAVDRFLRGFLN